MKSLIIYDSVYKNNTEKIARVLANKIDADLLGLKESKGVIIEDYDLIGFGSGVYKETISSKLFDYIEKLNLRGKDVFVFSTSGVGMKFYNKKLIHLLESRGAICKASFACKGSFNSREFSDNKIFELMSKFAMGHPNNEDLIKAEKFVERIVRQIKE